MPAGRREVAFHHEKGDDLDGRTAPRPTPMQGRAASEDRARDRGPLQELFDQDPKNQAESVFMTLVRVRAELAAEEERLNAAR
jgi:hypothetical protein